MPKRAWLHKLFAFPEAGSNPPWPDVFKELTTVVNASFRLIKEFEREGRTDGMPAKELADRKRNLVNELNNFIAMKKQFGAQSENREQLFDGAAGAGTEPDRGQDGLL